MTEKPSAPPQETSDSPNPFSPEEDQVSAEDRRGAVSYLLQLLLDARKAQAERIRVDASQEPAISFYSSEGPCQITPKSRSLPASSQNKLAKIIEERCFFWPDADDSFFSAGEQLRLHCAPSSPFRLMADYSQLRKPGTEVSVIAFDKIRWEGISPILERLSLSDRYEQFILNASRRKNGIVLVNKTRKPHKLDAGAIMLAIRPDALYYRSYAAESQGKEILELAAKQLVIVALDGIDPIDMIYKFSSTFVDSPSEIEECSRLLLLSFIHERVRKTCGSCSRATAISPDTLEKIPEVLHPLIKDSYMFSRGCAECGNAAYRGTVGLDSVLEIDDELRGLLRENIPSKVFTDHVYQRGVRTLLEDGIRKIFSGFTSFEEVFAVTTQMSPGFISAAERILGSDSETKHESETKSESEKSLPETTESSSGSAKKRLLIVEDESDQREVLQIVFQSEGFDVISAENGKHALELLESYTVDMIVCDIMMPVMNGRDFLKALRSNATYRNVPVMMLTAVGNPEDEASLLEMGADDFCGKNVRRKILRERVQRLLERKKKSNPVGHLLADD